MEKGLAGIAGFNCPHASALPCLCLLIVLSCFSLVSLAVLFRPVLEIKAFTLFLHFSTQKPPSAGQNTLSCHSLPWPKSLSSSPGCPVGPGRSAHVKDARGTVKERNFRRSHTFTSRGADSWGFLGYHFTQAPFSNCTAVLERGWVKTQREKGVSTKSNEHFQGVLGRGLREESGLPPPARNRPCG